MPRPSPRPYRPPAARRLARDQAIDAYGQTLVDYLKTRPLHPPGERLLEAVERVYADGAEALPGRQQSYPTTVLPREKSLRKGLPESGRDPRLAAGILQLVTATAVDLLSHEFDTDDVADGLLVVRNLQRVSDLGRALDELWDPQSPFHDKDLSEVIGASRARAQVEASMTARAVRISYTRASPRVGIEGLSL